MADGTICSAAMTIAVDRGTHLGTGSEGGHDAEHSVCGHQAFAANSAVLQVAEAMWQHVRVESPTIRPDLARYAEGVMQAMRDVCGKSDE